MSKKSATAPKPRNRKASRPAIPEVIQRMLWGAAAGRCEFAGCNRELSRADTTKQRVNLAEMAHIIAFSDVGPRGDASRSNALATDIDNLMLVCDLCHKLFDRRKDDYPEALLRDMKQRHERRILLVSAIDENRQSHVLLYGANIGKQAAAISYERAAVAMLPEWYPADSNAIEIGLVNSSFRDESDEYWKVEESHLRNMINQQVRPLLDRGVIKHLSIFGLAPQPLLMQLGFLLSDIPVAEVYQLHREPPTWRWQNQLAKTDYVLTEPTQFDGIPALVFGLSGTVNDDRIHAVLGSNVSIWRLGLAMPHNDFLQSSEQLKGFREEARRLMNRIKAAHGEHVTLNVFPAMPVAAAVDFGRVIMPKADLAIRIYDEHKGRGGFVHSLNLDACSRLPEKKY